MLLLRRAMATAVKNAEPVVAAVKKPGTGHPKKKNLFDVARLLPGWGVGHKVAKSHWKPQTYYKLFDIKLRKVCWWIVLVVCCLAVDSQDVHRLGRIRFHFVGSSGSEVVYCAVCARCFVLAFVLELHLGEILGFIRE